MSPGLVRRPRARLSDPSPALRRLGLSVALAVWGCSAPARPPASRAPSPAPALASSLEPSVEAEAEGVGAAGTTDTKRKAASWQAVSSVQDPDAWNFTLEQALNRALHFNRGLADARDAVTLAEYTLVANQAEFELKILPVASLGVNQGLVDADSFGFAVDLSKKLRHGTEVSAGPRVNRLGDLYTSAVDLSVTQPLLRGRDAEFVRSGVDAADFALRSAGRALHRTREDTVLATVIAVYQVVRQREFVRLNEDSAGRLVGHVAAAEAKERAGLAGSIDVFRARLQKNQAEDALDASVEAYERALDTLRIVLALPLSVPISVEAPLEFDEVTLDEEDALEVARANRVDLAQARDAVQEAQRRSRVAEHNVLPDLDLGLTFSVFGEAPDFGGSSELDDTALGVNLTTSTDVSRTVERALRDQTLVGVSVARRAVEAETDRIDREVRRELRDLRRNKQRIETQENQIAESRSKLELARVKFSRGLADNFDVIEAEDEYRQAQTQLISAAIDYIVGTYSLRVALGTLLPPPRGALVP